MTSTTEVSAVSHPEFRENLLALAGHLPVAELERIGFAIPQWQRDFRGQGNTINYATTLLQGLAQPELLVQAESELLDNLFTAISEHPLSDVTGNYHYSADWVQQPAGDFRLRAQSSYLDHLIAEGVDNASGQIPAFEILRNAADQQFLQTLTSGRQRELHGQACPQTYLQFSPSPVNLEDPQVRARGYQGNDQVRFHTLDDQGREQIEVQWFPRVSAGEYRQLASELGKEVELGWASMTQPSLDLAVMQLSGGLDAEQEQTLRRHVRHWQERAGQTVAQLPAELLQEVRSNTAQRLLPLVYRSAQSLLTPALASNSELIQQQLGQIYDELGAQQFRLRLYLSEHCGFEKAAPQQRSGKRIVVDENFWKLDEEQQREFVKTVGFRAKGCGFAGSNNALIMGAEFAGWGQGSSLSALFAGSVGESELYDFVCNKCGTHHDINVPLRIFVSQCKGCGQSARC